MRGRFRFRTRVLIYPQFQLAIIAVNLVIMGAFALCTLFAIHQAIGGLRQEGVAIGLPADHVYFNFLSLQLQALFKWVGGAFVVSLLLSVALTLKLSHRLAGPIHRLRTYLKGVVSGHERKPLEFRKGDYFSDLAEVVNQALERK